jgi:ribokinase
MGAACAYAGVLGHDPLSQFVAESLRHEGIDLAPVAWRDDARPVHSMIVVDVERHTRNIFFEITGATGADGTLPSEDVIRSAGVVFIDHYGSDGNIRVANLARAAGIPVVADFERDNVPRFEEMLDLVDHLIVSERFAQKLTGMDDPAGAARALCTPRRVVVIVTCGDAGCWSAAADGGAATHWPAFEVEVSDTTGCGDVFHGVYAASLARADELPQRIRLATAAAAIKATRPGAQDGAPTRAEVDAFLRDR